jgi:hypothetical protein
MATVTPTRIVRSGSGQEALDVMKGQRDGAGTGHVVVDEYEGEADRSEPSRGGRFTHYTAVMRQDILDPCAEDVAGSSREP